MVSPIRLITTRVGGRSRNRAESSIAGMALEAKLPTMLEWRRRLNREDEWRVAEISLVEEVDKVEWAAEEPYF